MGKHVKKKGSRGEPGPRRDSGAGREQRRTPLPPSLPEASPPTRDTVPGRTGPSVRCVAPATPIPRRAIVTRRAPSADAPRRSCSACWRSSRCCVSPGRRRRGRSRATSRADGRPGRLGPADRQGADQEAAHPAEAEAVHDPASGRGPPGREGRHPQRHDHPRPRRSREQEGVAALDPSRHARRGPRPRRAEDQPGVHARWACADHQDGEPD